MRAQHRRSASDAAQIKLAVKKLYDIEAASVNTLIRFAVLAVRVRSDRPAARMA